VSWGISQKNYLAELNKFEDLSILDKICICEKWKNRDRANLANGALGGVAAQTLHQNTICRWHKGKYEKIKRSSIPIDGKYHVCILL